MNQVVFGSQFLEQIEWIGGKVRSFGEKTHVGLPMCRIRRQWPHRSKSAPWKIDNDIVVALPIPTICSVPNGQNVCNAGVYDSGALYSGMLGASSVAAGAVPAVFPDRAPCSVAS